MKEILNIFIELKLKLPNASDFELYLAAVQICEQNHKTGHFYIPPVYDSRYRQTYVPYTKDDDKKAYLKEIIKSKVGYGRRQNNHKYTQCNLT